MAGDSEMQNACWGLGTYNNFCDLILTAMFEVFNFHILVIPAECLSGLAGSSRECQHALWLEVECLAEGTTAPANESDYVIELYSTYNLRYGTVFCCFMLLRIIYNSEN